MTYSVAALEVSQVLFDEIRAKLIAAGYHHTLSIDGRIDMTGICLVPRPERAEDLCPSCRKPRSSFNGLCAKGGCPWGGDL